MTKAEQVLWEQLRKKRVGPRFHRQKVMFGYIVDFWCPKANLVIEVDGSSHNGRKEYDGFRDSVFESHGATVVRFSNEAVICNTDAVVASIKTSLKSFG